MKIIKVSELNILEGECCTTDCPVALALKERLLTSDVSVSSRKIKIKGETFSTPEIVKSFIFKFDNRRKVKPFNFVLK